MVKDSLTRKEKRRISSITKMLKQAPSIQIMRQMEDHINLIIDYAILREEKEKLEQIIVKKNPNN